MHQPLVHICRTSRHNGAPETLLAERTLWRQKLLEVSRLSASLVSTSALVAAQRALCRMGFRRAVVVVRFDKYAQGVDAIRAAQD